MREGRVDVLVATPGRLIDHLENSPGIVAQLGHIRTLVLDEADQLLEMGFRPAIEKILGAFSRLPGVGVGVGVGVAWVGVHGRVLVRQQRLGLAGLPAAPAVPGCLSHRQPAT